MMGLPFKHKKKKKREEERHDGIWSDRKYYREYGGNRVKLKSKSPEANFAVYIDGIRP